MLLRRMHSCSMLRSFCCHNGASSGFKPVTKKKQLVFMGSPEVSVSVLDALFEESKAPDSPFQVAAIVTQPPSRRDRGRKMPSPVAQHALDKGFPSDLIFTPQKAGDEEFLCDLRALKPELCITAAYGNILPNKFLKIPPLGTVNVHPSLLPLYRGAAPVQRALQDGVKETGTSLVYTVRALDAGPVISCERYEVDDHIKATELLAILFDKGSELLIRELPSIFDGSAREKAQAQDNSKATHAAKLTPEEAWLSFDQEAFVLHNKVRAFAGWPGTRAKICLVDPINGQHDIIELKIITTRICIQKDVQNHVKDDVTLVGGALQFPCGGGTTLEVLELQLPGKKRVNATSFWNGLRGRKVKRL